MGAHIFTIGQGKRYQYAQDNDGFWFIRERGRIGWMAWRPLGTRTRPDNIWYNPNAGKANLPKGVINHDPD